MVAGALALTACDLSSVSNLLSPFVNFDLVGQLQYSGSVPQSDVQLEITLYTYLANTDSFNPQGCTGQNTDSQCYGEVLLQTLDNPVGQAVTVSATNEIRYSNAPPDAAYIMVVRGIANGASCSTDILGFDENTKLVTRNSVISPADDPALAVTGRINLPRAINIQCGDSSVPDNDDVVPAPDPDDETSDIPDDGNLPDPLDPLWTRFELRTKQGDLLADASSANFPGNDDTRPCGESIPLDVFGLVENAAADTAFIHIQEGFGEDAIIRDLEVPIVNGAIEAQTIQMSGGYARIQLDLAPIGTTDFAGASHWIEVCDTVGDFNWPTQELLVVTSWNTNDTDVDSHLYVTGGGGEDHIWYADRVGTYAELDVDDVDGYGPETITSNSGNQAGLTYDFRLHYYSDHGNSSPQTDVTVRVIYANESSNVFCDVTRVVRDFRNGAWENIGIFGPELAGLASSDPARFTALGCSQPE
jgi:hypothetical protein